MRRKGLKVEFMVVNRERESFVVHTTHRSSVRKDFTSVIEYFPDLQETLRCYRDLNPFYLSPVLTFITVFSKTRSSRD